MEKKKTCQVSGRSVTICGENIGDQRGLIAIVPIMAVIVMMIIVMAMIGLALVVVAAGARRAYGDGNLSFRFRGNQSEKPQRSEDQKEILFHMYFL